MSRIAKQPIAVPAYIEVMIDSRLVRVKCKSGEAVHKIPESVEIKKNGTVIQVRPLKDTPRARALAGTSRSLVFNMVMGANKGYERTLDLIGIGYRAQVKGGELNLALGFSHPINVAVPLDLFVETPSQTQIVIKGMDKQRVGQFAAEIRTLRPPEPYKGKGIRYSDERVVRKEAKKK